MADVVVKEAAQELVKEAAQEVSTQVVKKGVMDQAVTVIKNNRRLIMWTLVFAGLAVGGVYLYEQHNKQKVEPVNADPARKPEDEETNK